jgi:hypothetical protein
MKGWLQGVGLSYAAVIRHVQKLTGLVVTLIQTLSRNSILLAWPTWTGSAMGRRWLLMVIRT